MNETTTLNELQQAARKVAKLNERRMDLSFGNLSPDLSERIAQQAELKIATDLWQRAEEEYRAVFARYR